MKKYFASLAVALVLLASPAAFAVTTCTFESSNINFFGYGPQKISFTWNVSSGAVAGTAGSCVAGTYGSATLSFWDDYVSSDNYYCGYTTVPGTFNNGASTPSDFYNNSGQYILPFQVYFNVSGTADPIQGQLSNYGSDGSNPFTLVGVYQGTHISWMYGTGNVTCS